MIVLTSTCASVGGCHAGSPQEQWLRGVLAANPAPCTVAYWHHPRFSSGSSHDGDGKFQPFWEALYEAGAELVLSGHTHAYERFAPQTPDGGADAQFGLRQLTIGLGGKSRHSFGTIRPNSEFRYNSAYAVLKLTLHAAGYEGRRSTPPRPSSMPASEPATERPTVQSARSHHPPATPRPPGEPVRDYSRRAPPLRRATADTTK